VEATEVIPADATGPATPAGDAVFFFERANIVHMGDLMSHRGAHAWTVRRARLSCWRNRVARACGETTTPTPSTSSAIRGQSAGDPAASKGLLTLRDSLLDAQPTCKGHLGGQSAEEDREGHGARGLPI
jgi:hypothetical protein